METILIKGGQLLASLSILVILHELGHFIPAKLFKTKVEKFYLFFDPWFSLFKVKKGDTEYGVGWLPLGGYVKIAGMIDESMDKEQLSKPPEPWEFRAKPAWQRLIIMLGGVTVNLLLGILIYSMTLFAYGEKYLPVENMKDGVWVVDSLAYELGIRNGDMIKAVNGKPVDKFQNILPEMLYGQKLTIVREGQEKEITIPENIAEQLMEQKDKGGGLLFYPRIPFIIASIPDTSHNINSGLQPGDSVVAINGTSVNYLDQAREMLEQKAGQQVTLTVKRKGELKEIPVEVSEDGKIGVLNALLGFDEMRKIGLYEFEVRQFGFFESIPAGLDKAIDKLVFYVKQFKLLFNPDTGAYKGLGGFGTIGGLFPPTWEWQAFWEITAFLSLILAFMNILPIPALDGGHVLFLLYEIISGRKPSEKFLEKAQIIGMIILLTLLVVANGNDIIRMFK